MSIRAGQLLHVGGNRFQAKAILDRLQSANLALNIPSEKVYELGNFLSVADKRDTPELSFDLESRDVSVEFEALLADVDFTAVADGTGFNLGNSKPIDILAPFKAANNVFTTTRGLVLPYLYLESATYRFGVGTASTQSFTMRGDGIYFTAGAPRFQSVAGTGGNGPFAFATTPAVKTVESSGDVFAYCVTVHYADGTTKRLFHGADYTNTATGFTLTNGAVTAPSGSFMYVTYAAGTDTYLQAVHEGVAVKPADVRGSDIDVYVSDGAATPTWGRWEGLQTAELNWRLTLEAIRELGNEHVVEQSFDVPDLTGTLSMRPESATYLYDRISQITGVPTTETINALSSVALDVMVKVNQPGTSTVLKTFIADNCRFTPPSWNPQANTRLDVPFAFSSDTGQLTVYKGDPGLAPAA